MTAKSSKTAEKFAPIVVISGKDNFLVTNEYEKIVETLLSPEERHMGLLVAEADKMEVAEILDELRTLPFLASRRVIVLKDAENFISKNRETLEKYLDSPCKSGTLVLCVSSFRSNTRLAKKVNKIGSVINVGEIKRWELSEYVVDYARNSVGKRIDKKTAEMIVELVGDEPGKLCSEIDKLALFVGDSKVISEAEVCELTGHNREFDVFGVIDSITQGNADAAISKLRNMFTADKSAEFTAVGGFAFHFRRMFNAKLMQAKREPMQKIANTLRIFGDRNSYFSQLSKWSLEEISKVLQALARIDYESKVGQTTIPSAIEQLVIKATVKQARR